MKIVVHGKKPIAAVSDGELIDWYKIHTHVTGEKADIDVWMKDGDLNDQTVKEWREENDIVVWSWNRVMNDWVDDK